MSFIWGNLPANVLLNIMPQEPPRTYYEEQVIKFQKALFPQADLVRRIIRAKDHMTSNFQSAVDLNQIADVASFSKFHFIRLFKLFYGCTPYQYLLYVRIREAKALLHSGENVLATSIAVGFASVTSFTGLFKKITGMPPSAFVRMNARGSDPGFKKAILKRYTSTQSRRFELGS